MSRVSHYPLSIMNVSPFLNLNPCTLLPPRYHPKGSSQVEEDPRRHQGHHGAPGARAEADRQEVNHPDRGPRLPEGRELGPGEPAQVHSRQHGICDALRNWGGLKNKQTRKNLLKSMEVHTPNSMSFLLNLLGSEKVNAIPLKKKKQWLDHLRM